MPEFDLHAAIKRLAEAKLVCPKTYLHQMQLDEENILARAYTCTVCNGTGFVVPFASLRRDGQGPWSHQDCIALGHCDLVLLEGGKDKDTTDCGGHGWMPERDVEKAAHRVARRVQELDCGGDLVTWWYDEDEGRWYWNNPQGSNIPTDSYEEAVLCAAEALAKEQQA